MGKVKYSVKDEFPREKMLKDGVESLSNAELIAVLLRTGSKNKTVIELANELLKVDHEGIRFLKSSSIEELCEIEGIGISKATLIKAALELGVRVAESEIVRYQVKNPWDIYKYYMESMRYLKEEIFKTVLLNTKNEIITDIDVSHGTLNSSLVHPREVFKQAIKKSANKIILIHNHPSGNVEPSNEDMHITDRLIECGKIIGIEVIDHIIIGDGIYYSFKESRKM
ncbi:RadC family protein [Peptacetobacter hiranonis]|uniref:RadC family protein n=1 Tax=Peptacetobacter hiranonis TaxID=89152 RepID=UPI0022E0AE45|nr:DNA repair protein RadC [Peptacetobacter hiranonis]